MISKAAINPAPLPTSIDFIVRMILDDQPLDLILVDEKSADLLERIAQRVPHLLEIAGFTYHCECETCENDRLDP